VCVCVFVRVCVCVCVCVSHIRDGILVADALQIISLASICATSYYILQYAQAITYFGMHNVCT